jgi:AcrR family transcriptional regulator
LRGSHAHFGVSSENFLRICQNIAMLKTTHPTKSSLIECAADLLDKHRFDEITVEMVLDRSGISKGSLYHHFEDIYHLLEAAMIVRYARYVDTNIAALQLLLSTAKTGEEFYLGLSKLSAITQGEGMKRARQERALTIGRAITSPRMSVLLQGEQQRLTDALAKLIKDAQARKLCNAEIDSHSLAVLMQAWTLGKIVDDLSESPVDNDAYLALVNRVIREVFVPK